MHAVVMSQISRLAVASLWAAIVAGAPFPSLAQQPGATEKDKRPTAGEAAKPPVAAPPSATTTPGAADRGTSKSPAQPASPAPAAKEAQKAPSVSAQIKPQALAVPRPEVLLMLMRTTLIALNQANFTGNYTVLHGLGTPALQAKNSSAQLGIAFTSLRNEGLDLSPVLVLSPELTESPTISPEGVLRLAGFFPTKPQRTSFVMVFQPVAGKWLLDGLSVTTSRPPNDAPAATAQPQSAAQERSKAAPGASPSKSEAGKADKAK